MMILKRSAVTVMGLLIFLFSFADNAELKYIGMPVGGICTGQVYLGGDGQLWNWDIFNIATTDAGGAGDRYYLNPMTARQKFINGFGITVNEHGKVYSRMLNRNGFSDITFEGEYPIGKVHYKDYRMPVEVHLSAYSPFIPTDADNSGLPLVKMEYTVRNVSEETLDIELDGWLQNMSCYQSGAGVDGFHYNKVSHSADGAYVTFSSDNALSGTHPDWGTMTLALLDKEAKASAQCQEIHGLGLYRLDPLKEEARIRLGQTLVGGVGKACKLKKGEEHTFSFVIAWNFPNIHLWNAAHQWRNKENLRYYYSKRFHNSDETLHYLVKNPWLGETTKLWNKTWYDSTLPKWFLDRTFTNVSTLATTASMRFDDLTGDPYNEGRFYNFEGVYLGEGTCRHVSHYGQVVGRIFPELCRHHREQIDLGLSLKDNGIIGYRGEFSSSGQHDGRGYAVDGQAGTILGFYREYLMSPNKDFLERNWSKIKKTMSYMIDQDQEATGKPDGILEGKQYNTLDRIWYGKISWLSGLYAAALKASSKMAWAVHDKAFAKKCDRIADRAFKNISSELFNGEYFIQKCDARHAEAPNTNNGCHTDQMLGQYWAKQLDLGYIVPKDKIHKALTSILKYNFKSNYGAFLKETDIPVSRWYADNDEAGVICCSFPRGGSNLAPGHVKNDWEKLTVGYFSEMWTGQEHALAALLLDEGLVEEAMKVEEAVNRRYTPERRNPYNEIEYGNHYTRAMSSYAPFISASGFNYNGPEGILGFNPKVNPENFKSAFITAEGWGNYSQRQTTDEEVYVVDLKYGSLTLNQMQLPTSWDKSEQITLDLNNKTIQPNKIRKGDRLSISFPTQILHAKDVLTVRLKK